MKTIFWLSTLLFVQFLSLVQNSSAQTSATIVKVDSLQPGDVFDYVLIVKKNEVGSITYPDSSAFGEDFEIRSFKHFKPDNLTDSLVFQLQYFGVGDRQLPEIPIFITNQDGDTTGKVTTDVVPVFYNPLIEDEKESALKPLKPIFDFAANYWVWILLLVVASIIAFFLYRYFKKKAGESTEEKPTEPKLFVDPLRELDRMLEHIKTGDVLKQGDFKAFYTETGDAIRLYIERVYKEQALEMTTSELKYALLKKRLDPQVQNMILLILSQADRVKFAKYTPTMDSAFDDLERAFDLAKKFREADKSKIAQLRYDFEVANGLRKPEQENAQSEEATS